MVWMLQWIQYSSGVACARHVATRGKGSRRTPKWACALLPGFGGWLHMIRAPASELRAPRPFFDVRSGQSVVFVSTIKELQVTSPALWILVPAGWHAGGLWWYCLMHTYGLTRHTACVALVIPPPPSNLLITYQYLGRARISCTLWAQF